jgi:uncharacterized protein (DUF4415 family)
MKDADMKTTIVRYEIDLDNLPPLTEQQKAELAKLKSMRDEDIDFSDAPALGPEFWANAVPWRDRHLYRPVKKSTTVRIDSDVLAWLKSEGEGYQTRLNAILREAMLKDLGKT